MYVEVDGTGVPMGSDELLRRKESNRILVTSDQHAGADQTPFQGLQLKNSIFIAPAASARYGRIVTTANPRFLFCHENRREGENHICQSVIRPEPTLTTQDLQRSHPTNEIAHASRNISPGSELTIPDYELLKRIGAGAYGEVWLARSILNELRAVKVIHRNRFSQQRPFEREFDGIRHFEPFSRSHPSQLSILHVGKNEGAGYFYYVMELADEASSSVAAEVTRLTSSAPEIGQSLVTLAATKEYIPRTLRHDLERSGRLPVVDCIKIALSLTTALAHLHKHGLVHRDIKPSNVIFVNEVPKLGDIGLVTEAGDTQSIVGTEGYIPPEGPGTAQADIFSLGKVLYEICTGMDRRRFPELPEALRSWPDRNAIVEFNEILLKACAKDPDRRYQSAVEMRADLDLLRQSESVKRKYAWKLRLSFAKRFTVAISALTVALTIHWFVVWKPRAATKITWSKSEEANEAYQKGLREFHQNTADMLAQATANFERAVALDPTFARAKASLALAYISMGYRNPQMLARAWPIAEEAVRLDPTLDDAHRAVGVISSLLLRDWTRAEEEYTKAIKLNPRSAENFAEYAYFLSNRGRTEEAVQRINTALRLDSRSYSLVQGAAFVFQAARQPDEVIKRIDEVIARESLTSRQATLMTMFLVPAYVAKGDYPMAIQLEEKSERLKGKKPDLVNVKYDMLRKAYRENKGPGYWRQQLKFELLENGDKRPVRLAAIHARLGEREAAIDYLRQALLQTPTELVFEMNRDPSFDSLRQDSRFMEIVRELGK
jgi:serine/threonine protein kinase/Flp pilus assembly protein TadD